MLLVDSSVWIDFLRGIETEPSLRLRTMVDRTRIAIGDLILAEVLQGCDNERDFEFVLAYLSRLQQITISNRAVAVEAARNYRSLRTRGITVRKTIDTLIATRCIMEGLPLLYSDRDFDPFVEHLGLRSALS
jgi:predicted nucleic acid-binding protein